MEDIGKEILDIADIVIDYGLVWSVCIRSSTLLDYSGPKIHAVRIGACYDIIKDILTRFWQIKLPSDPGKELLPSGHPKIPPLLESLEILVDVSGNPQSNKNKFHSDLGIE